MNKSLYEKNKSYINKKSNTYNKSINQIKNKSNTNGKSNTNIHEMMLNRKSQPRKTGQSYHLWRWIQQLGPCFRHVTMMPACICTPCVNMRLWCVRVFVLSMYTCFFVGFFAALVQSWQVVVICRQKLAESVGSMTVISAGGPMLQACLQERRYETHILQRKSD
jgi:hypothetical protein